MSNYDAFYYCDATNEAFFGSDFALPEYSSLPRSDAAYIGDPMNDQFWPDDHCDGISNYAETNTIGCAGSDPGPECYTCPEDLPPFVCDGPMSFCDYKAKNPTYPVPECAASENCVDDSPAAGSCVAGSWGDGNKDDWLKPEIVRCDPENNLAACTDDEDNDRDGKENCYDPDCYRDKDLYGYEEGDCPEVPLELKCNNGIDTDEDNDGKVDCADPDCSEDLSCTTPPEPEPERAPGYERINCYKNQDTNLFAECCPKGATCFNPLWMQQDQKNVFGTGASWLMLGDVNIITENKLWDRVNNMGNDPSERKHYIIPQGIDTADIEHIKFHMWYSSDYFTVKVIYEEGDPTIFTSQEIKEYTNNLYYPSVWHTVIIPGYALTQGEILDRFEFEGTAYISIDNAFFENKADSLYSDTRYCSGTGAWIEDLDEERLACQMQVPTDSQGMGLGGIGWTGNYCCGDDSTYGSYESFPDTTNGCFMGNIVNHNRVVGDLFDTESLDETDPDANKSRDVLFYDGQFFLCDHDGANEFAENINYIDPVFKGLNQGNPLIPDDNRKGICVREGSYFCSQYGFWLDQSQEGEVWEDEAGQNWRCRNSEKEPISTMWDFYNRVNSVCTVGMCYCPGIDDCEEDDCPGYEACDGEDIVLDEFSCLDDGTKIGNFV